jgi:two-component system phosphate regulon response regulator PhoB
MPKKQLLVVEDETSLVEVLTYNLKTAGYEVVAAPDGREGLDKARLHLPDLILLDLMLPVIDGLQVCRELRADIRTRDIPVLMLTAKAEEVDEVVGFQMGADDYVSKPFRMTALLQRIKALLRRGHVNVTAERDSISIAGLHMDRIRHQATLDERELKLTLTEFRLLWALARQPGRAFTRNELMDASLGEDATVQDRTIDVHVKSIRQKLGDRAEIVETVRGVGYRFLDE